MMRQVFAVVMATLCGVAVGGMAATDAPPSESGVASTLKTCLMSALTNNPSIREAELSVEAAGKGVGSAAGKHYPRLSLDGSITARQDPIPYVPAQSSTVGPRFSDRYAFWGPILTIPLYQGGQISRNVDLARLRQRIQADTLSLTRNELIANVVNTFNKILQLRKLREASAASVKALEEQRKNVQQLYDVKRAARVDLLKVEVQLANEKQRLLTLDESLTTLGTSLATLMGTPADGRSAAVDVAGSLGTEPAPAVGFDDGLKLAHTQRPEYLIALKGVEEAGLNVRNAQGKLLPTINVLAGDTAQIGFAPSHEESDWFVGAALSLPLFDSSLYSDLARERVQQRKAVQHLQVVENQIRLEIQVALSSLEESRGRIAAAERSVAQADESFRIEQQRYQTGAGSMADMLLAQAADVTAAANYAQALFDYNAARVALRRATGTTEEYLK